MISIVEPVAGWSLKTAFKVIDGSRPFSEALFSLVTLQDKMKEALGSSEEDRIRKAAKLLRLWRSARRLRICMASTMIMTLAIRILSESLITYAAV